MARTQLILEDFGSISLSTLGQKYSYIRAGKFAIGTSYGRTANGLRISDGTIEPTTGGAFAMSVPGSPGGWCVEFAMRVRGFPTSEARAVLSFHDSDHAQAGLLVGTSTLKIVRGAGGGSAVNLTNWIGPGPVLNTWHQVAVRYYCSNSNGYFLVWLDKQLVAGSTVPDTAYTSGSPDIVSIKWGHDMNLGGLTFTAGAGATIDITDISIALSDYLYIPGDYTYDPEVDMVLDPYTIITLRPESDNSVDFTPSTSPGDNCAMVDDADNDGDTTYNSSDTLNDADHFNMEDIPAEYAGCDVLSAQINIVARQTYPGGRAITPYLNSRAGDESSCSVDYKTHTFVVQDDGGSPASALTEADINSATIGYEITT